MPRPRIISTAPLKRRTFWCLHRFQRYQDLWGLPCMTALGRGSQLCTQTCLTNYYKTRTISEKRQGKKNCEEPRTRCGSLLERKKRKVAEKSEQGCAKKKRIKLNTDARMEELAWKRPQMFSQFYWMDLCGGQAPALFRQGHASVLRQGHASVAKRPVILISPQSRCGCRSSTIQSRKSLNGVRGSVRRDTFGGRLC